MKIRRVSDKIAGALLIGVLAVSDDRALCQEGPSLWGTKPLPLRDLLNKATFRVIVPKLNGAYQPSIIELAWLAGGRPHFSHMPPRQVACFFYTLQGYKGSIAVLQTKSLGRAQAADNVYQAIAEGRFFSQLKGGSVLLKGTSHGVDFIIVSHLEGVGHAKHNKLLQPLLTAMKHAA